MEITLADDGGALRRNQFGSPMLRVLGGKLDKMMYGSNHLHLGHSAVLGSTQIWEGPCNSGGGGVDGVLDLFQRIPMYGDGVFDCPMERLWKET